MLQSMSGKWKRWQSAVDSSQALTVMNTYLGFRNQRIVTLIFCTIQIHLLSDQLNWSLCSLRNLKSD